MGIVDRVLKAVRSARRTASPMSTLGVGGTPAQGGFLQTKEKSPDLIGTQRYVTYSNLLANVMIIATGVRFFVALVSKVEWRMDPVDDTPAAQEAADFALDVLNDMTTPWHRVVRKGALYRFYGYSMQEWTAKRRDDGKIGLKDVEVRPQSTIPRWDLDDGGTVLGFWQENPKTFEQIYIPRLKCLYLVDDALDDSAEGMGIFRHVAKASQQLLRLEQLEGFGYETDLHGVPVVRGPFSELAKLVKNLTITQAQRVAMEKPLRDFVDAHYKSPGLGLMLDSITYESKGETQSPSNVYKWGVDLLKGDNAAGQKAAGEAIERKQREIARMLGVEHLMLGSGAKGSFAMSRDKTRNFALLVDGTLMELRTQAKKDLLEIIWALNGLDPKLMPEPQTEAVQHRAIEEVTGAIADMAAAGAPIDPEDEIVNEVRGLLGMPDALVVDDLDGSLEDDPAPGGRKKPKTEPKTTPTVSDKEEGNES